jgi:C4-dicarboxylate-specific signal transduction histidine kinase
VAPIGLASPPLIEAYGWYAGQLRQGRTLVLNRMPDDLPDEAMAERARARMLGMESLLAIPLTTGDRVWGAIGLAAVRRARHWTSQEIQRLRLVGEIIMDALVHREAQEAARHQRDELAHLARVVALGELTAALAHELNQPLAAIRTNAEALELFVAQGKPIGHLDSALADIIGDATRAGSLIRRLHDLLRRRQMARVALDINRTILDVRPIIITDARRHGVGVTFRLAPDLPRVWGDTVQLQQVVLNLVRNAAEAMAGAAADTGEIAVSTSRAPTAGQIMVSVDDAGPAIDDATFQLLFAPFQTTKPEGLGMGLAISRSIIQAHGGHLWAERRPEGGLAARFTIPARTPEAP